MNRAMRTAFLASAAAACLLADVTYDQTVKFTGGSMVDLMHQMASNPIMGRLGGSNLKNALQDQTYSVYVKGNKMARIGQLNSTIYDLDAGTITLINNEKRTYTRQTFEEMHARMEEMQRRMSHRQGSDISFDAKVEKTGQTRNIGGQETSEVVFTLTAKGEGSGGQSGQMVVKDHAWIAPVTATTQELIDFGKKLSEKYAYASAGFIPALGAANNGLADAMKEALSQGGYPVLSEIEVSGVASPMMRSGNSDPTAPFMQMESQSSNFGQGPVDDSKFAVPAGYKQEQPREH